MNNICLKYFKLHDEVGLKSYIVHYVDFIATRIYNTSN
jgi:hypothetical protein